jgi:hypothetical protein
VAPPSLSNGLMQEDSGGFVSHTTSACEGEVSVEVGFYTYPFNTGAGSISITAHWSFTGQLYAKTDCTPGGTHPLAWADGYVTIRLYDQSTGGWMGGTVIGGSFGSSLHGCTAGQTATYSQFYTVQTETASETFSSLSGTFEVYSTFFISDGGFTPSATLASGAGGCSGLNSVNNGASCTGNSISGAVLNQVVVN